MFVQSRNARPRIARHFVMHSTFDTVVGPSRTSPIGMKQTLIAVFFATIVILFAGCDKPPKAANKKDLPVSAQMLFAALDTLMKADERPDGITPEANVARITPLLQQVVDDGAKADRAELNSIYPGLGDHFLDDAVAHARLTLQSIKSQDDDAMTRSIAAILRWQKWWGTNKKSATAAIVDRYG